MESYLGLEVGGHSSQEGFEKRGPRLEPRSNKMEREIESRTGLLDQPVGCGSRGKTYPVGISQALLVNSISLFNMWHWAKVLNIF